MARKQRLHYSRGTCFLVPLRDGGFARGVVARLDGKGVAFGYFFPPRLSSPDMATVDGLDPRKAALVGMFGDLSLIDGDWPVVGLVPGWTPEEWPMPPLIRVDDATGRATLSHYDDHTLHCTREEAVSSAMVTRYPYDRMMGAGAVEIRLSKLLGRTVGR